jgi:Zn-dependent protease with chaperone function
MRPDAFLTWLPLILIGLYLVLTVLSPLLLGRPVLLLRHPRTVMWGWLISLVCALALLVTAMVMLVIRSVDRRIGANEVNDRWAALADVMLGWFAIAVLGLIVFRLGAAAAELRAVRQQRDAPLVILQATATEVEIAGIPAVRVESDARFIGVVSTNQVIMISSGLASALQADELAAAVRHEAEHVRGFHEVIRTIGSLAVAAAPVFPASTAMAQAARIATELIADDAAAREYGPETVARALALAYPASDHTAERIERLGRLGSA